MKYYVKSTGITLVGTITNISLFTAQLLCLLHVQVCIRKSSVKRTITALNHSVSQHDVHTTENDTSSEVFFGRHTTELQNMSVVRSLPELEYGGNCLELTSGRVWTIFKIVNILCEMIYCWCIIWSLNSWILPSHSTILPATTCRADCQNCLETILYVCVFFVALSVSFYRIFYVSCV